MAKPIPAAGVVIPAHTFTQPAQGAQLLLLAQHEANNACAMLSACVDITRASPLTMAEGRELHDATVGAVRHLVEALRLLSLKGTTADR